MFTKSLFSPLLILMTLCHPRGLMATEDLAPQDCSPYVNSILKGMAAGYCRASKTCPTYSRDNYAVLEYQRKQGSVIYRATMHITDAWEVKVNAYDCTPISIDFIGDL